MKTKATLSIFFGTLLLTVFLAFGAQADWGKTGGSGGALSLPLSGGTLTGPLVVTDGGNCSPLGISFAGASGMGIANYASGRFAVCISGAEQIDISLARTLILSGTLWMPEASAPTPSAGSTWTYADSTAHNWKASYNGDAFAPVARSTSVVQTNAYTNATTGFTTVLTLSLPVGQWDCQVDARYTESTGADGMQLQVTSTAGTVSGGGTSTYCQGEQDDGTAFGVDTDAASQTCNLTDATTTAGHVSFHVDINVATTLTYELQGKQNAHTTGTLTVAGSSMMCVHM